MHLLQNLNKISWKELDHAYGKASKTPILIRKLLAKSRSTRVKALSILNVSIYHQGGGYSASPKVIPFFLELLQYPAADQKEKLLSLIANLAIEGSNLWLEEGINVRSEAFKKHFRDDDYMDSYREAEKGIPIYLKLLSDPKTDVRNNAAYILTWFSESAPKIVPVFERRLHEEKNEKVRTSLLLGLGILSQYMVNNTPEISLLSKALDTEKGLAKSASAISLSYADKKNITEKQLNILKKTALKSIYIFDYGDIDIFAIYILMAFHRRKLINVLGILKEIIFQFLKRKNKKDTEIYQAIHILACLIELSFKPIKKHTFEGLSNQQKQILMILVDHAEIWLKYCQDLTYALEKAGLPGQIEELAKFMKIIPARKISTLQEIILGTPLQKKLPKHFLKHQKYFDLVKVITKFYPFSTNLLRELEFFLNWNVLSGNESIAFNQKLFKQFSKKWNWYRLSSNKAFISRQVFIETYQKKIDWGILSCQKEFPWSEKLIEKYKNKWNWDYLSQNSKLPWSADFIAKYKNKWNWKNLSENCSLPWSKALFEKFSKWWDITGLCENNSIPWNREFIEENAEILAWGPLCRRVTFQWTEEFIEKYKHKDLWWFSLSGNPALDWSIDFIKKYKDKWDWSTLSGNAGLPWSENLIDVFREQWHFGTLLKNPGIRWTPEMKKKYWDNIPGSDRDKIGDSPWPFDFSNTGDVSHLNEFYNESIKPALNDQVVEYIIKRYFFLTCAVKVPLLLKILKNRRLNAKKHLIIKALKLDDVISKLELMSKDRNNNIRSQAKNELKKIFNNNRFD